jgi:transposase InsO family protein
VLVELGLVEQRFQAVLEVLNEGATVTDVARRYGVARQTVHGWLRRYAGSGLAGLSDRSSKPASCPHQMPVEVEARVVALRRANPGWGPRRLGAELAREGLDPVPARSSIYRALVRHCLIEPSRRRRRRSDYKRWERSRAMELWQLDVMGRVRLVDRSELSVVTGIDDHSRFCVIARLVRRATARPVCEALLGALEEHGVPEAILTDNGKVFTGRFGLAKSPVLFDRICHDNGIRHLLTAPRSPTTTGKIERLHKTMRAELFNLTRFASLEEGQDALDAWVRHYNLERPHQGIGDRPPIERFRLAEPQPGLEIIDTDSHQEPEPAAPRITRRVSSDGAISLAGFRYRAGRWLAGEVVEVVSRDGIIEISHRGALIVTHARRHPAGREPEVARSPRARQPRTATVGNPVLRTVDSNGAVSFAGTAYRVGNSYRRRQVQVAVVRGSVQVALDGKVIRSHPIRHDRGKEHGAFATPQGRPRKRRTVVQQSDSSVTQVPEPIRRARTGS